MKTAFADSLRKPVSQRGFNLSEADLAKTAGINGDRIGHGAVVIAAIMAFAAQAKRSILE